MASPPNKPITVALVDDYDVVVMGVANMFDKYRDRIVVAELDANMSVEDTVDIVLYDSFAQPESDHEEIAVLSTIRARAESWSTPGTFTRISSAVPGGRVPTAICRRRCLRESWSPRWRRCMPARR